MASFYVDLEVLTCVIVKQWLVKFDQAVSPEISIASKIVNFK